MGVRTGKKMGERTGGGAAAARSYLLKTTRRLFMHVERNGPNSQKSRAERNNETGNVYPLIIIVFSAVSGFAVAPTFLVNLVPCRTSRNVKA